MAKKSYWSLVWRAVLPYTPSPTLGWMGVEKSLVVYMLVWAYQKDRLLVSVNTNNGVERQNKTFKYGFLAKKNNVFNRNVDDSDRGVFDDKV